jgi:hypothetical protein
VAAGATPVGGGTALYSAAFPATLGPTAVLLREDPPRAPVPGVLPAATTLDQLAGHTHGASALRDAAAVAANPAVRRRATLGGWVALRAVRSDVSAPLVVLGAQVVVLDSAGRSSAVPITDYLEGRAPADLITEVLVPRWRWPSCYRRVSASTVPGPLHLGLAGVRCPDGSVELAVGGVGRVPDVLTIPAGTDPGPQVEQYVLSSPVLQRRLQLLFQEVWDALD